MRDFFFSETQMFGSSQSDRESIFDRYGHADGLSVPIRFQHFSDL